MNSQIIISSEETAVINRVAAKFLRQMRWNAYWELEDVRQELFCFWIEKRQRGWIAPENWHGAMGRCLNLHLKDLIRRICSQRRKHIPVSLNQIMADGHDFAHEPKGATRFDFIPKLNSCESQICNLILEGRTKSEIAFTIKRSRAFINKRLSHVRKIAEEFAQI